MRLLFFSFVALVWISMTHSKSSVSLEENIPPSSPILSQFRERTLQLRNISQLLASGSLRKPKCNFHRFIHAEGSYGDFSNSMIELVHGLYLAKIMNGTFIPGPWSHSLGTVFDFKELSHHFCFIFHRSIVPRGSQVFTVPSHNLFSFTSLYSNPTWIPYLPPWDQSTILEVSKIFLLVYGSLWSSVRPSIVEGAQYLIHHHLGNDFMYLAAHKRDLDGQCTSLLNEIMPSSTLKSMGVPFQPEEDVWYSNSHPVCEMRLHWMLTLANQSCPAIASPLLNNMALVDMDARKRVDTIPIEENKDSQGPSSIAKPPNNVLPQSSKQSLSLGSQLLLTPNTSLSSRIFLAFDGKGSVMDYQVNQAVFSTQLSLDKKNAWEPGVLRFIDMLVAMHAQVFVLNPRSTFSFQIFVIRSIWGLPSAPILSDFDVYGKKYQDWEVKNCSFASQINTTHAFWVSLRSISEAVKSVVS